MQMGSNCNYMLQYCYMKPQTTYTIDATVKQLDTLKQIYGDQMTENKNTSVNFMIKTEECTITAYKSNKVVFQGPMAAHHVAIIQSFNTQTNHAHAGSDEVGTGDYFGPVCVCAVYIPQDQLAWVQSLSIKDSKQLTDQQVAELAIKLQAKLTYSLLILPNDKYNKQHQKDNMNALKAKLHNQAYLHLQKKVAQPFEAIIDQFTPKSQYFKYLQDEPELYQDLKFETKAENKYLAVACAAIIARYAFLRAIKQLSQQVNMEIPKGASDAVDQFGAELVKKHGWQILDKVAKVHFKNTEKIKEILKTV